MKTSNNYQAFLLSEELGVFCKDGKFRNSVSFGTPSWTCKFWRKPAYAERAALKAGLRSWTIKYVYEGDVVTSSGEIKRKS